MLVSLIVLSTGITVGTLETISRFIAISYGEDKTSAVAIATRALALGVHYQYCPANSRRSRQERFEEMNFKGPLPHKTLSTRLVRFFTIFSGVMVVGAALTYLSLPMLGKWLVREDPIHEADAIAVLTGSLPARALEAAQLYRDGYAKEIWLTHPGNRIGALNDLGIHYPSEDEFNVKVLRREGVPASAIHVFEMPIANTADELDVIGTALKERRDESVIVVTSKSHTRRVHSIWNKYHLAEGTMMVHAVTDDEFQPATWWKSAGGTNQVLHEVMGMMNVWAGMPVQSIAHNHESVAFNKIATAPKVLRTLPQE